MTQQEFEERTALNVTTEEYIKIEELYYASGDMDKDTFCNLYKQIHGNALFQLLADKLIQARSVNKIYQQQEDEVVRLLVNKAAEHDDEELEKKAIDITPLGRCTTIKIKCEDGLEFSDEDREYIHDHISRF